MAELCGASNGHLEFGAALADGHAAGEQAARHAGHSAGADAGALGRDEWHGEIRGDGAPRLAAFWRSPASSHLEKRQFVDLQNDVTVADLRAALAEGFADIEHVKRYTTLGIGTEQGATSSVLGAAILAELKGEPLDQVGTFRSRAPYRPVALQTLAGSARRSGLSHRAPHPARRLARRERRCARTERSVDASALLPVERR